MHEVKKPFAGIKKLSIWHGKPFFLLQKPFFLKIKPFKKTFFFHKVELTACYSVLNCVGHLTALLGKGLQCAYCLGC